VNVGTREPRSVLVQAGAFAEHRFDSLEAEVCTATPGPVGSYAAPEPEISNRRADVGDNRLLVDLAPLSRLRLRLTMSLHVNAPTLAFPWDRS